MENLYNRYVPGHNGSYERITVSEPARQSCDQPEPTAEKSSDGPPIEMTKQQHQSKGPQLYGLDLGDILLLCIIILLLIDSNEEETMPLLIMTAALLLQQ